MKMKGWWMRVWKNRIGLGMRLGFWLGLPVLLGMMAACQEQAPPETPGGENGRIDTLGEITSAYVDARRVDVWLPPGYQNDGTGRYAVIYMHDGQNLFRPGMAFGGEEWGIDETLSRLTAEKRIPGVIVVGIWNTPKRRLEYQPAKFWQYLAEDSLKRKLETEHGGLPLADGYLKFIVAELKPLIDRRYRTLGDRDHTFIMGSSMGGLISIYALAEYPEIFGAAACLSTHWPVSLTFTDLRIGQAMCRYLEETLPAPGAHQIYFDYGTETLDARYEPFQQQVDAVMHHLGYTPNTDWMTRKFEGASHNEKAWRERADIPLKFLLK